MRERIGIKARIKRLLPRTILNYIRAYRTLTPRARSIYGRLQLRRHLNKMPHSPCAVPIAPRSILFVCRGNVIRSPMAAAIFKQQLANAGIDGVFVSSAGLHAQPQEEADLRAKKAAHEFGISLDDHCARLLTHSLVQGADVIFAMDGLNEAELMALYPEAQDKVYMLGRWGDFEGSRRTEIPDPYDGDEADIQQCCEILQSCVRGLTSSLFGKISPRREDSCKSVGSVSCHAR